MQVPRRPVRSVLWWLWILCHKRLLLLPPEWTICKHGVVWNRWHSCADDPTGGYGVAPGAAPVFGSIVALALAAPALALPAASLVIAAVALALAAAAVALTSAAVALATAAVALALAAAAVAAAAVPAW